jgi:hypothetical protein
VIASFASFNTQPIINDNPVYPEEINPNFLLHKG